jgi:hypothetical protein
MLNRIFHKAPLTWVACAFLVLVSCYVIFVPRQEAFELVNGVIASLGLGIGVGFAKAAYSIARSKTLAQLDGSDVLILGVAVTWPGLMYVFLGRWLWRITDSDLVANHWSLLVACCIIVLGAIFHLAAAGAKDGVIPRRSYMITGAYIAIGLGLALILITLGAK